MMVVADEDLNTIGEERFRKRLPPIVCSKCDLPYPIYPPNALNAPMLPGDAFGPVI